ncbi:MAG: single-stranded DNA-binding protein [Flavobacteriales bacterium]|nr:single-stranded DNA-binding protein [Flavobacteriales bacterium]
MAGSLNKVTLIGRLGQDPEIREVGMSKVANFSVATDESYTDKSGNKVEKTEWHKIVMWNKPAETAERYLKKGSLVYIEGKLETRSWENDSGEKRYSTEIKSFSFQMLENRNEQRNETDVFNNYGAEKNNLTDNLNRPPTTQNENSSNDEKKMESSENKSSDDDLPF